LRRYNEGIIAAGVGGIADGMQSTDLGAAEGSNAAEGTSISLQGSGFGHEKFTWAAGVAATPGAVNTGQTMVPPEPSPPLPPPPPSLSPSPQVPSGVSFRMTTALMGYSSSAFDTAARGLFKSAVADKSAVTPELVTIISVTDVVTPPSPSPPSPPPLRRLMVAGVGRCCSPRQLTHVEPSSLELDGNL